MVPRAAGFAMAGILLLLPVVQDARASPSPIPDSRLAYVTVGSLRVVLHGECAFVTLATLQAGDAVPPCRQMVSCDLDTTQVAPTLPCALPHPIEPPCDPAPDPNEWNPADPGSLMDIISECCPHHDLGCALLTTGWLMEAYTEGHVQGIIDYCVGIDNAGRLVLSLDQTCTGSCTTCGMRSVVPFGDYVCASVTVAGGPARPSCVPLPLDLLLGRWPLTQLPSLLQGGIVSEATLFSHALPQ